MRRLLLTALISSGCGATYSENDLELLTRYRAKELCSCLFVIEQTEDFCAKWTVAAPNLASYAIDRESKRVETSAMIMWGASARWVDVKKGCVLE